MIWLLLDYRAWLVAAIVGLGLYAAVQRLEKERARAEFAQFRADVESEAAKAKVRAAQEAAQQAQHAQEVLDDLATRNAALSARYERLRHANAGSGVLSAVPEAAAVPSPGPVSSQQPDPDAGCLAALEWGDQQLAKYADLWKLEQANAR